MSADAGRELGALLDSIPAPGCSLEERVADRDEARRQLAGLKSDERSSLGLLAAGFSYKEIAARRGWTYTKVNRCVSEGRLCVNRSQPEDCSGCWALPRRRQAPLFGGVQVFVVSLVGSLASLGEPVERAAHRLREPFLTEALQGGGHEVEVVKQ